MERTLSNLRHSKILFVNSFEWTTDNEAADLQITQLGVEPTLWLLLLLKEAPEPFPHAKTLLVVEMVDVLVLMRTPQLSNPSTTI
ncbi:unnamed protein product, partial [Mesorhabditis belari]|uniref:Uncharacterized protein n=1 Tax=Mesorhabditis belari TaxID=2138241 RepID=A0AAF3EPV6_9BILA